MNILLGGSKKKEIKSNACHERGQSTIEFALIISLLLGFSLFFIQMAMVFGWGNYIQYATFMASRAYLSAGPSIEDQKDRAKEVISKTLKKGQRSGADRLPMLAKGIEGDDAPGLYLNPASNFNREIRNYSWLEGIRYKFRSRMFLLQMGQGARPSTSRDTNGITLTSESWLGREPATDECEKDMIALKGDFDNGC